MEATFAFVDLAGFSALTETHGDEAGADLALRFTSLVKEILDEHVQLVDVVGDAVFVAAESPIPAVRFVERLWHRADVLPGFPALRAGVHQGEVVQRGVRYFGTTVNVAARIAALARGGQVLASIRVAMAAKDVGIPVELLGMYTLYNLRESVELYILGVGPCCDVAAIDPVCRMRVRPEQAAGRLTADGREYLFCSLRCAALFAADPGVYTRSTI